MQAYLHYLFDNFIIKAQSKQFAQLLSELLTLKPVDLTKGRLSDFLLKSLNKPSSSHQKKSLEGQPKQQQSELFNIITLLLAKNVLKYSSSNCQLQISVQNVLIYQRMNKFINFSLKYLHQQAYEFIKDYFNNSVENGCGYPIMYERSKIDKLFPKTQEINQMKQDEPKKKHNQHNNIKNKQTKQETLKPQQYNYHKLIYEYKAHFQPQKQTLKEQINTPHNTTNNSNNISKNKQNKLKEPSKTQLQQSTLYMLNIEQLTRLLKVSKILQLMSLHGQGKPITLAILIEQEEKKQSNSQSAISLLDMQQQVKFEKLEQFIAQCLGNQCLLLFNLIKKFPYITQKQLSKLTLLDVLQTRRALSLLVEQGYIYFYYENSRTINYKLCAMNIMQEKYLDVMGQASMNLMLMGEKMGKEKFIVVEGDNEGCVVKGERIKQKILQLECEIQGLDDIMLIFGI